MDLGERIAAFSELGAELRRQLSSKSSGANGLNEIIENQYLLNPWFTPGNVRMSLNAIADELTSENLYKWMGRYQQPDNTLKPLRVGIIMAGNIPLVGFHDFLTVLITGNSIVAKLSSKDSTLMTCVKDILCGIEPAFKDKITFTDGNLENYDVIIATGSDNSSRYFEYYFRNVPNIIRKNRNSIAVLDGRESDEELALLGNDIFSYFGLGCRSVSKIFVPKDYNVGSLSRHWLSHEQVINHTRYANNYDYNKAVFLVNREQFFDTGFLLMKEDTKLASPVSVLHFEHYNSAEYIDSQITSLKNKIQCIIGHGHIPFGQAQSPHLWDYADGTDTVEFLLKKNLAGIL